MKSEKRFFRPGWAIDVCYFAGYHLLWAASVLWLLGRINIGLDRLIPQDFRAGVAAQPWWLQLLETILLSDFFMYWGHRLQHCVGFLWRFHAVHHSTEHLDWLAAHREHPLDTLYTLTLINLPPLVLGFPMQTIAGFLLFRGIWAAFLHANVRIPLGAFRLLLGAPELHHWHHANVRGAGNFATFSPLMDWLFGTYHCPEQEPEAFGLQQPLAGNYFHQLLEPFLPRRKRSKESHARRPRRYVLQLSSFAILLAIARRMTGTDASPTAQRDEARRLRHGPMPQAATMTDDRETAA